MDEPITLRDLLYAKSTEPDYFPSSISCEELVLEQSNATFFLNISAALNASEFTSFRKIRILYSGTGTTQQLSHRDVRVTITTPYPPSALSGGHRSS